MASNIYSNESQTTNWKGEKETGRRPEDNKRTKPCSNQDCFELSAIRQRKKCHRCGKKFCKVCLQEFQISFGREKRQAKICVECTKQDQGAARNLTDNYMTDRNAAKLKRLESLILNPSVDRCYRKHLDLEAQCKRLADGFFRLKRNSLPLLFIKEATNTVHIPEWQRSPIYHYDAKATTCYHCNVFIQLFNRRTCRVCGMKVCRQECSSETLMVYRPDDEPWQPPTLILAGMPGWPEREPVVSCRLVICKHCFKELRNLLAEEQDRQTLTPLGFFCQLSNRNDVSLKLQHDFNQVMTQCTRLVDDLCQKRSFKTSPGVTNETTMKIVNLGKTKDKGVKGKVDRRNDKEIIEPSLLSGIAQAQEDIKDILSKFVNHIQEVNSLQPKTAKQKVLLDNFAKGQRFWHEEAIGKKRKLQNLVEEHIPKGDLLKIRQQKNKHALSTTYLIFLQLAREISDAKVEHKELNGFLQNILESVEKDLKVTLQELGMDWSHYLSEAEANIHHQVLTKPFLPIQELSTNSLDGIWMSTCCDKLFTLASQMTARLNAMTSSQTFVTSKHSLLKFEHWLKRQSNTDYEFVDLDPNHKAFCY